MSWIIYASLAAVFAAMTAILAKIGIKNVDSNLATAIRTTVILIFTWGIVAAQKNLDKVLQIDKISLTFLVLSALATGASWLFYFKALQIGDASKVVPIDKLSLVLTIIFAALFLKESISWQTALGAILMTAGTILIAFAK